MPRISSSAASTRRPPGSIDFLSYIPKLCCCSQTLVTASASWCRSCTWAFIWTRSAVVSLALISLSTFLASSEATAWRRIGTTLSAASRCLSSCSTEPQRVEVAVAAEHQADVDLAALERRAGQRPVSVQGLEGLEVQAVQRHQARQAVGPRRALGSGPEDQLSSHRLKVRELGQAVLLLRGLGDRERVLIDRRRWRQRDQVDRLQVRVELGGRGSSIARGLAGALVVILEVGGGVADVEVDLT